ncbi:hypothetical protein Tco_0122275 [Tanacetum coccineum]
MAAAQNINNSTLRSENKLAHLEQPFIPLPLPVAPQAVHDTYQVLFNAQNEVACLMLASMSPQLPKTLENYKAYDMIQELKTIKPLSLEDERLHGHTRTLGYPMAKELGVSLILNSLNKDYDLFAQKYNMHSMWKAIVELHTMLKLHEKVIPKKVATPAVLAIRGGMIKNDKKKPQGAKGKDKG